MIIHITRRETFNAAHRMYREEWSAEKNEEIFGKCANPNWHGHNYNLFVTVKGEVSYTNGYLIDLKQLKAIIQENAIEKLDHKNLNLDVDFMQGKMVTTELLCMEIFNQLKTPIEINKGVFLHSVRLHETENNSAEYFGG
ncbi:6-pyruvoyltetrahydropterin/6-carboxytetrahydropterin synthase [Mucilaginibacter lappiensis]|uniref:6-carboxy-5,6,7,8-tetrahydropterin synthase n=1 Tax=Mucilaginibacter lappiensis TaxID=354630 RepID=A0A841JFF8_9SPHI|nr:6-carboxytetrahydropterin synthase [Mucilaginibacter lappiensis]MBB6127195.1 6-pyruvoyltetrahydropterin/6-carboxytetrahydropterin synthase [Mucilaginibacter lappiensis]